MVGTAGKSAQIPLYVWLPDAMEGRLPFRADPGGNYGDGGRYMVARSSVIFERAPIAMIVVAIIGTLTAFFAATIGIAQTDIKRVLAYSTVSRLGYMFIASASARFRRHFPPDDARFFKGLLSRGTVVIHGMAASRTCADGRAATVHALDFPDMGRQLGHGGHPAVRWLLVQR